MFETAATGVLTDGTPIYGDGRVDQSALAAAETVYSSLLNESKVPNRATDSFNDE